MEDCNTVSTGGGKAAGGRTKATGISTSTRLQRNQAEKERRDKLNGFISELATLVPMVSNASKPLDKVSILRLAAAEMRLHFSCLNPKRYKNKPLALPPAVMASLDLIEKTVGGFIIVTTLTGLIVFCSRSIEDYLGYQNIDVMGNKIVKYIYEDDVKYFEAKVNSVVNSLKKSSKKKAKVIKAHMLQKPLPRSNEGCRPRNMIFKLSVHQNDLCDINGTGSSSQSSASIMKKTRTPKDFGYSAVVLMFIEPVRLEPEIDITYIDSNQDIYFTRHGLQGEIIYADQRISSITGYMPHDVQGQSAYQYICSSDVPIALFAQKAMFTSSDGKGDIVYRLRIRDMRFIYLQSSGQIAYKESSNEISHFVCFNKLLSEDEGSQELKKFQQRYAPQIMAAKMLEEKQNIGTEPQTTNPDPTMEQMNVMNSPVLSDTSTTSAGFFRSPESFSTDIASSASDQIMSGDSFMSPLALSVATSNSVHSSDGHSMTSPVDRSSSKSSEYNVYPNEKVDLVVQKTEPRSPLLNGYNSFVSASTHETVINIRKGMCFNEDNLDSFVNGYAIHSPLVSSKSSSSLENTSSVNGSYRIQHNGPHVNAAGTQILHSVNAFGNVKDSSEEIKGEHTMGLSFDPSVLQNSTSFARATVSNNSSAYIDQNIGLLPTVNGQQNEYNGQVVKENHCYISLQGNLQLTPSSTQNVLQDQRLNFNGKEIIRNGHAHPQELLDFSGLYDVSSVSSLSKDSNNPLSVSDLSESMDYCQGANSYHENDNLSTSVSSYNNGANIQTTAYSDVLNPKTFGAVASNPCDLNGFHVSVSTVDVLARLPAMNSYDTMDTSMEMLAAELTPERTLNNSEFGCNDFPGIVSVKLPMTGYQNGSSDPYPGMCGPDVAAVNWAETRTDPIAANVDLSLNKELYEELDLFFQNLPQSNATPTQNTIISADPVSEFPISRASSYSQNSISSRAKKSCHQ